LRAVSADIDLDEHRVLVRFIFDGKPSDSQRDAAACAGTEIISDDPGWDIPEEFIILPAPAKMDHLRLVVFQRSEDPWVGCERDTTAVDVKPTRK
jgi:hypothetical protein